MIYLRRTFPWVLAPQTLTPLQLVQGMLSLGMRLATPGPQPWLQDPILDVSSGRW